MDKERIGEHMVMNNFTENLQSIFRGAKGENKVM